MGFRLDIPVLVLIIISALVSTCASMAGGLILYYQGIESLEDTVEQSSRAEVAGLQSEIREVVQAVEGSVLTLKYFMYSQERIKNNNNTEWAHLVRSFVFSQVRSVPALHASQVALATHDPTNSSAFWSSVWADLTADGNKEYVFGSYYKNLGPALFPLTPDGTDVEGMMVPCYALHNTTGYIDQYVYEFNAKRRYLDPFRVQHLKDYTTDTGFPNKNLLAGAAASQWTSMTQWRAYDNNLYFYAMLDFIFPPPPPPHPWSTYKAVGVYVGLMYNTFQKAFDEFGRDHPEKIAFLVELKSGIVYASTYGGMARAECTAGRELSVATDDCVRTVSTLPLVAQEGVAALSREGAMYFGKSSLDGSEHYIRRAPAPHKDLVLVWLQPVSAVQSKFVEALIFLILFTVLVLVFDMTVAIMESVFIAFPLKRLSAAITALGDMHTEIAMDEVATYQTRCLMVREVRTVVDGMTATAARIQEFKAFMPAAIQPDDVVDDDRSSIGVENTTSASQTSHSTRPSGHASSLSSKVKKVSAGVRLSLYLEKKSVTLAQFNLVKCGWTAQSATERLVLEQSSLFVGTVVALAMSYQGVLDTMSGDRLLFTWNAARAVYSSATLACDASLDASNALREVPAMNFNLSCAVASGSARVGNIGTMTSRRFTVISDDVMWVQLLETLNKTLTLKCTLDNKMREKVGSVFELELIHKCIHPKSNARMIWNIVHKKESKNEEWMYQLEADRNEGGDLLAQNSVVRSVLEEKFDALPSPLPELPPRLSHILESINKRHFKPLSFGFSEDPFHAKTT